MEGFNKNDDEFRKEFMRFLKMYESGFNNFFNQNGLGPVPNNGNPLEELMRLMGSQNDIDSESGMDNNGQWVRRSWTSPDGRTSFNSFTRSSSGNTSEFEFTNDEIDTIDLLKKKLNKAVINEDYENAAKIRDLIDSLKDDKKEGE